MNASERARSLTFERLRMAQSDTPIHHQERTLVIIDMQNGFIGPSEKSMVPDMCVLIRHAMVHSWGIILVEYNYYGSTNITILDEVAGYRHLEIVKKDYPNGGVEVTDCLSKHPDWSLNLLVCGIYGNECVAETVAGIFEENDLVEIDVVTDLVSPPYCSHCDDEYGDLPEREITMAQLGIKCNSKVEINFEPEKGDRNES